MNFALPNRSLFCYSFYLIFACLSFSGCNGAGEKTPKPENLIPEHDYIDLMIELQHIRTYRNSQPNIVRADSLKAIIYEKYDISEEQFLASHQYYQKQIDRQLARVDEVISRLEQEEQYIQSHIDSMKIVLAKQDSLAKADSSSIEE